MPLRVGLHDSSVLPLATRRVVGLSAPSMKPRSGGFDGLGDRGHSRAVEFPALPEQWDVEMVIGDLGQPRINELVREHPHPSPARTAASNPSAVGT